MKKIKTLVMDVDGTLTDGKIYMGSDGELFKAFDVKDGYALNKMLPARGIKTVFLTGRRSTIVQRRADELAIDLVLQGIEDKEKSIYEISDHFGVNFEEIAYIGDDLADYKAMKLCGIAGCPADAVKPIIEISDYVTIKQAGNGAAREFVDWMVENGYI